MEIKKDILWRVYLCYIIVIVISILVMVKAFYIQQVQGAHWRSMSDSLHQKIEETDAERGTIFSEDGNMLSTNVPLFDVYIDFGADGLRENNGKRFKSNLDSLSYELTSLFSEHSEGEYRAMLLQGFEKKDRYYLFRKNISYNEYKQLIAFSLIRLGRNKSGFIIKEKSKRLNPYNMLAYRTIGISRDSFKVGLELSYDSVLRGKNGKRLVRYIAGGVSVPVEDGFEAEAENGRDIITTIDVFIQEIAENELMKAMIGNEAEHGCVIVMETKTGKIKAIANLGKDSASGNYFENYNYAINLSEPGSTFKLATLLALLEDKKISLSSNVNLEGGTWKINGSTVFDSEQHGRNDVTVKEAFELSSNVGMAKLAWYNYGSTPLQFIKRLHQIHFDTLTGIDLSGERNSIIYRPGRRGWSEITIPWMAFGYNIEVTPIRLVTFYNAIANNGTMMRPYLVNLIKEQDEIVKEMKPVVVEKQVCSSGTLQQLKECLEGVCTEGTAKNVFKNSMYKVAGKTGTALVANGRKGYTDEIYQASFCGYFPADNPQYTCLVVIKNKPHAIKRHGAEVAAPVFKEIADRIFINYVHQPNNQSTKVQIKDSTNYAYFGNADDIKSIMTNLNLKYLSDNTTNYSGSWVKLNETKGSVYLKGETFNDALMPDLKGMKLKDALYICEKAGLKVNFIGNGKVINQSVFPGIKIEKGQNIKIVLN